MRKFLIRVNGNQYEVEVEEIKGESPAPQVAPQVVAQPSPQPTVQAAQPAPQPAQPKEEKEEVVVQAGEEAVEAPMPGTILRIEVKEGEEVKEGQILAILEAMKMENEILAPRAGRVKSILTSQGASVNTSDKLIILE